MWSRARWRARFTMPRRCRSRARCRAGGSAIHRVFDIKGRTLDLVGRYLPYGRPFAVLGYRVPNLERMMRMAVAACALAIAVFLAIFGVVLAQKGTLHSSAPIPAVAAAPEPKTLTPPAAAAVVTEVPAPPTRSVAASPVAQPPVQPAAVQPAAVPPVPAATPAVPATPPVAALPPPPAAAAPLTKACAGHPTAL